jgi:hypothetical protein
MSRTSELTQATVADRLRTVFRIVTVIVCAAILTISGSLPDNHVHSYTGHEHAEHHHAPASHPHDAAVHRYQSQPDPAGPAAHIEDCDPGGHAVYLTFACSSSEQAQAPFPALADTHCVQVPVHTWVAMTPSDVRAHGPPPFANAPLRAPPPIHLA